MNGVANGLYGGDLPNQINTPWIDFSEQSTIVGWSSYTNKQIRYKQIGNIVYVAFNILGTSNSTSTTFTIPILPRTPINGNVTYGADSSGTQIALVGQATVPSNIVTMYRFTSVSAVTISWTASGTKQINGQFFYEI